LLRRRADAEQLVERGAWVANHRQRLFRTRPADRVGVDAGVAVGATAGLIDVLDAQLQRWNSRILTKTLRVQLIERDADLNVGSFRLLRVHLGQEYRARTEVIAADFLGCERFGVADVRVADDGHVIAEGFERAQAARRQVEAAANGSWRPH